MTISKAVTVSNTIVRFGIGITLASTKTIDGASTVRYTATCVSGDSSVSMTISKAVTVSDSIVRLSLALATASKAHAREPRAVGGGPSVLSTVITTIAVVGICISFSISIGVSLLTAPSIAISTISQSTSSYRGNTSWVTNVVAITIAKATIEWLSNGCSKKSS